MVITSMLVIIMACLSSWVILNNPGMSIGGWLFVAAPVAATGIIMAIVKASAQSGYNLSVFFNFFSLGINKKGVLLLTAAAVVTGVSIIFNPFDYIMLLFMNLSIFLFLLSIYMLVNHKMIDAVGLLLISLPFINYMENQLVLWKTGFDFDWITIKTAVIILFSIIWTIVNIFINRRLVVKGKFNALILIFIFITFLSAVFSADIVYSLKRWLFEIIYPLIFYFIITNSIRYEIDIKKFISYLIAGVFLNLILILYYFAKYGSSNIFLDKYFFSVNFADGIVTANVLIMVMPLVIAFLAIERKIKTKLLFYALITVGITGIVMSFARMAQVSMGIGLFAFIFLKMTRKHILIITTVLLLFFIFNHDKLEPYLGKYAGLSTLESIIYESTMEKRYEGWDGTFKMFRDHPLTGVGIGRYSQEYANYSPQFYEEYARGYVSMNSAHNIYLNYLAETGIQGLLVLLLIFSSVLLKCLNLIKRASDDNNYIFSYSLFISIIVFLINNFVSGATFAEGREIDKGMVFWIITAIIASYGTIEKNKGIHYV